MLELLFLAWCRWVFFRFIYVVDWLLIISKPVSASSSPETPSWVILAEPLDRFSQNWLLIHCLLCLAKEFTFSLLHCLVIFSPSQFLFNLVIVWSLSFLLHNQFFRRLLSVMVLIRPLASQVAFHWMAFVSPSLLSLLLLFLHSNFLTCIFPSSFVLQVCLLFLLLPVLLPPW